MSEQKQTGIRRFLRILNVAVSIFMIVLLITLLVSVLAFKDSSSASFFGQHFALVNTGEMGSTIPEGSAVMAKSKDDYNIKDIVLYNAGNDEQLRIHRIVDKIEQDDGMSFVVKGDSSTSVARQISPNQIISSVRYYSNPIGAFLRFATSLKGMFLIAVIPCLFLILIEFAKLLRPEPVFIPYPNIGQGFEVDSDDVDEGSDTESVKENEIDDEPEVVNFTFDAGGKAIYDGNTELEPIEVAKLFNQTKGLSEVKPSKDEPKEKVLSSGESSDAGKAEETSRTKPEMSVDDVLNYIDNKEIKLNFDED